MSKKEKTYSSVLAYVKSVDKDFALALKALQSDGCLSLTAGRHGLTVLLPNAAERKRLLKMLDSDKTYEEAIELIGSHFIGRLYKDVGDFKKVKSGKLFTRMGTSLEIKSINGNHVTLDGGAKLSLDKVKKSVCPKLVAIWKVDGKLEPSSDLFDDDEGSSSKGGREIVVRFGGVEESHYREELTRQLEHLGKDAYANSVVKLMNYMQKNNKTEYDRVLQNIDTDARVSWMLLVEPGRRKEYEDSKCYLSDNTIQAVFPTANSLNTSVNNSQEAYKELLCRAGESIKEGAHEAAQAIRDGFAKNGPDYSRQTFTKRFCSHLNKLQGENKITGGGKTVNGVFNAARREFLKRADQKGRLVWEAEVRMFCRQCEYSGENVFDALQMSYAGKDFQKEAKYCNIANSRNLVAGAAEQYLYEIACRDDYLYLPTGNKTSDKYVGSGYILGGMDSSTYSTSCLNNLTNTSEGSVLNNNLIEDLINAVSSNRELINNNEALQRLREILN
jgi:hypothetical protein